MVDVTGSARRLVRNLWQGKSKRGETHPGDPAAAAGHTAVAITETAITEAVTICGSYPSNLFLNDIMKLGRRERKNLWGRVPSLADGAGSRGSLAGAMGMATAGLRATVFLSGTDLLESQDLLARAAGRRLPLVVHLAARARAAHASAGGGGHDAIHAAGEAGATVLVASSVQEAVDFTLVARRLAEDALVPVVVAMDGEDTGLSVQDLFLPDPGVIQRFVGDTREIIHAPAPSQEILFGKHRRRVPRWHDPERPYLTGPSEGANEFALGEAGRYAYLDASVPTLLENALAAFEEETGRAHAPVSEYRMDDAEIVLVAMGSMVETAEAAADRARRDTKLKVGVIGIRVLRPFPEARVVALLKGRKTVAVLERSTPEPEAPSPLLRDIQAVLDRAHQNFRFGPTTQPVASALDTKDLPRVAAVFYGLGGYPVRGADLQALVEDMNNGFRSPVFLGIRFSPGRSDYPKRQVLLDALKRDYPDAERLGLRGEGPSREPVSGTLAAVHRLSGRGAENLAGETAALLHRLDCEHVNSRSSAPWESWGARVTDRVLFGPDALRDPGDDALSRIAVWMAGGLPPGNDFAGRVAAGGTLVVERSPEGPFWTSLPSQVRRDIREKNLKLYAMKSGEDDTHREERLLGAMIGILHREERVETNRRKALAARRGMLEDLDPAERDARLAAFGAGFDAIMPVETGSDAEIESEPAAEVEAPRVVRRLRRTDEAADSLARFWDQVGVLHGRGESEDLVPDPYLASGILPPLSSSFRSLAYVRDMFPAWNPSLCTACGDCWSVCPDSSMTPVAIPAAALLETGMHLAREAGVPADVLRPLLSKLTARVNEVLAENPEDTRAGAVLQTAFDRALSKSPLPADRKQSAEEAFAAVRKAVERLPLARTGPFFDDLESKSKGSGELFSLAMSPDACKGCALCVAVCEPRALTSLPEDPSRSRAARTLWELFEALPDPTDATLEHAREHPEVGPVAAAMLTRSVRESFAGGDGAEPASGEKTALRELLAVAYSRLIPRHDAHREQVEEIKNTLSETIRNRMAQALPTGDLDALSEGLNAMGRPEVNLAELSTRIETAFDSGRVDVPAMQRLVATAREINDLSWSLSHGEGGLGRTPFGVVFGPGTAAAWASAFPNNPFGVPVTVDSTGEAPELALGILEGYLQEVARGVGTLRRARLEIDRPKDAARAVEETRGLTWDDLTPEERLTAPPLFLVLNETAISSGLGGLSRIWSGELPIKVVLLSECDLGTTFNQGAPSPADRNSWSPSGLEFLAMVPEKTYIAQTSAADPVHLDRSMVEALDHPGPALLRVHAPSPQRHGFPKDRAVERAREAVRSRAFPLFRFDPRNPGMNLEGNPDIDAIFPSLDGEPFTPAGWALGEKRFAHFFSPPPPGAETVPLTEYLDLSSEERKGKTPVISREEGEPAAVKPELVQAVENRIVLWKALGDLSGHGERVSAPAEPAPASPAVPETDMESVRAEYEARIEDLSTELRIDMARKVRGRLLTLLRRRLAAGAAVPSVSENNGSAAGTGEEGTR